MGTSVPSTNLSRKTFFDFRSLNAEERACGSETPLSLAATCMRVAHRCLPMKNAVGMEVFKCQNNLGEHAHDLAKLKPLAEDKIRQVERCEMGCRATGAIYPTTSNGVRRSP